MNSSPQSIPDNRLIHTLGPLAQDNTFLRLGEDPNCTLIFPRFALLISGVCISQLGLSLTFSLAFPNGSLISIPHSYLEMFLQKLNSSSEQAAYEECASRGDYRLSMALEAPALDSSLNLALLCLQFLKEQATALENALETVGIIKPRGKKSLFLKRAKLLLGKEIVQGLRRNKETPKATSLAVPNPPLVNVGLIRELKADEKTRKGGFFEVRRVQCLLKDQLGREFQQNLACKTPRKTKNNLASTERLKKEFDLVSRLMDPTHFPRYYLETGKEAPTEKIYMEHIPQLLKEYVSTHQMSVRGLIALSQQLIEAVKTMHESGIVHRDLKPENILVKESSEGPTLKVIDFGESSLMGAVFEGREKLGCTLPYSPIECVLGSEQGFNKPEIDLWSVSMILYEMAFDSIPLFYARCIGPEIIETWKNKKEFSMYPLYRQRMGARCVEQAISLLSISGLQLEQSIRLKLHTLKQSFETLEQFIQSL